MIATFITFIGCDMHPDDTIVFNYPVRFNVGDEMTFETSPYESDKELMIKSGRFEPNGLRGLDWYDESIGVRDTWTVAKVSFLTSASGDFSQHIDLIEVGK